MYRPCDDKVVVHEVEGDEIVAEREGFEVVIFFPTYNKYCFVPELQSSPQPD